jgi:DNA polymerase/3'-5' exonuclease PolX
MSSRTYTGVLLDRTIDKVTDDVMKYINHIHAEDAMEVDRELLHQLLRSQTPEVKSRKTELQKLLRHVDAIIFNRGKENPRDLRTQLLTGFGDVFDDELRKSKMFADLVRREVDQINTPRKLEEAASLVRRATQQFLKTNMIMPKTTRGDVRRKMTDIRNILNEAAKSIVRAKMTLNSLEEEGFAAIQTAVARKATKPPRELIDTLVVKKAAQAMRRMFPQIESLHLVGSRLRHQYGRDLDYVGLVKEEKDLPGRSLTDLKFGSIKVNIFFALPDELEMTILEFGLGFDIMRWKRKAIQKGYKLNRYGLWRGPVRVTNRMTEVSYLLDIPLKPFLLETLENPL